MNAFPYALPNLFSGIFILISAMSVVFGLDETHDALRDKPDYGRKIGKTISNIICRRNRRRDDNHEYARLATDEETETATEIQMTPITRTTSRSSSTIYPRSVPNPGHRSPSPQPLVTTPAPPTPTKSPFRRILTKNVLLTLTAHHLLALHVSTFNVSPLSPF